MRMARMRYSPPNGQTWNASSTGTPMKAKTSRDPKRDAILPDGKDRHVGGVTGLELAGLAVEHVDLISAR